MNMKKGIGASDIVWVRLTDDGVNRSVALGRGFVPDREGRTHMPFGVLVYMFGPMFGPECPPPFVDGVHVLE